MRKTSNAPSAPGSRDLGPDQERVPAKQVEGTERTRSRPVYVPRVDIVETDDALELLADMPGVTKDSVEITLEQRVLRVQGRAETATVAPPSTRRRVRPCSARIWQAPLSQVSAFAATSRIWCGS